MYYLDGYIYMDMLGQKVKYPCGHGRHDEPGPGVSQGIRCCRKIWLETLACGMRERTRSSGYTINDAKMNEYMQMVLGSTGLTGMLDGLDMKPSQYPRRICG